jgi:hypothetical protein
LWINFATEAEKNEYEHIIQAIHNGEAEVDSLISDAMMLACQMEDPVSQAYVSMATGDIHQGRYRNLKMDGMRGQFRRAKWWLRLKPLHRRGLEKYLFLSFDQIRRLNYHLSQVTDFFLRAAELFRASNDPREAHVFYNLANNLRIAEKFRRAMKYLEGARIVAEKHNEQLLLKHIDELARIVADRNKDVPII